MDKYANYDELTEAEREGADFTIREREGQTCIAVMAPHGGCIEPGTLEIADAVAGDDHHFYAFDGHRDEKNRFLHITSSRFDEPRAVDMCTRVDWIVTIHGAADREPCVYVGGLSRRLVEAVTTELIDEGFHICCKEGLMGKSRANLCNRGRRGKGLQLEITFGLRKRMFPNLKRGRRHETTGEFDRFVNALRRALSLIRDRGV